MKNVEALAHHNSRYHTQNVEVFMKNVEAPAHYNSRSRIILPQVGARARGQIPTRSTNDSHITSKTCCTSAKIF